MDNVEPIYYGISQKVMPQTAAAKEGKFCPVCGKELDFEYSNGRAEFVVPKVDIHQMVVIAN